ncbi:DNA repair protein RecO (recombination protein O) [Rhodobium orientis]|uniref:DNA repair protein RecO n=1 Tax=Rhodobium orientis TaxID=34017 RepID=A0A327JM79_9HYPH|nr:DNA repair protein RecO [Rhodobium orientis]MBB4304838.1 DNA repair protein RecO (recombination protein O) [Rhodobium orientis]MBK5947990.1 DNA repair protein RecO [Rhodobium orientis]RAI27427.1 DNA repair protein RecO [Rhodobium orientis]
MEWSDEGTVIGVRRHGETSVILEMMTVAHGRHLGLVRGGRSRRHQATLQPGNDLSITWRARLDSHLGLYAVEPLKLRAANVMETAFGVHVVQTVSSLLRLLPERDPHQRLHLMAVAILDHLSDAPLTGELLVRFETRLLEELGFGLDLTSCAATGTREDLAYVSPKSARAVSRQAGQPYKDKLLPLPPFLLADPGERPPAEDISAGLALTGFFLTRHIFEPRGLPPLRERDRIVEELKG